MNIWIEINRRQITNDGECITNGYRGKKLVLEVKQSARHCVEQNLRLEVWSQKGVIHQIMSRE
jgi:hypothetical protein